MITKQITKRISIILVGTDVCICVLFVWEETEVPGKKIHINHIHAILLHKAFNNRIYT